MSNADSFDRKVAIKALVDSRVESLRQLAINDQKEFDFWATSLLSERYANASTFSIKAEYYDYLCPDGLGIDE